MLENWDKVDWTDAYVAHGVDGTRCSIQRYLFNREGFCTDPDMDLVRNPPSASPAASTTPSATSASSTTPTPSAKPTPLPTLSSTAMRLPGNRQSCVVDPSLSLEIACGSAIQICARADINCAVTPSVTTCSVALLNEIFSLYYRANACAESACNSAGSAMLNTCVAKTDVVIGDVCNSSWRGLGVVGVLTARIFRAVLR
ncbi:hypothetical protein SARC_08347 [Sphaeroforma arctica JP610]|uniref:Uncharacterized protein n=1 Tax=Sphaeroforma arctica JP610 TaxID=667725 RepID=A0A0L0FR16_9EUKA|nr:hypothetical protein SARC_08347 [Sphaeroforma arctica JP610]KNC79252.1 hypothetical protein SARC_08347 [Sphaeroforma arctica JP610]|eukprot:XP_014153154.1 hypothetical protein SARC_08347 [Sphaeroforma arctica JP610]